VDLEQVVQQQMKSIVASGKIEKLIGETLEKTIKSIIDDSLRQYSPFGKDLQKKLDASFRLGDCSIPEYNAVMCGWITETLNRHINNEALKNQVLPQIEELFKPYDKKEIKVSEIVEKFKESVVLPENKNRVYFELTRSTHGDGWFDLYLDEDESKKSKYDCAYQIRCKKDGIWHVAIEGVSVTDMRYPHFVGFDKFIFQLMTCKVVVINDEDKVDTELDGEED
jgi:hypothetical protein